MNKKPGTKDIKSKHNGTFINTSIKIHFRTLLLKGVNMAAKQVQKIKPIPNPGHRLPCALRLLDDNDPAGLSSDIKENIKKQLFILLNSPDAIARRRALKVADGYATPDIAKSVAGAVIFHPDHKFEFAKSVKEWTECDISLREICKRAVQKVFDHLSELAKPLLVKLYNQDKQATVRSLLDIYAVELHFLNNSLERKGGIGPHSDIIESALIGPDDLKDPILLGLAEKAVEHDEPLRAARIVGKLALPEGIEILKKLAQKYQRLTGDAGGEFLNACAILKNPDCIPLLGIVSSDFSLHAKSAATMAKILEVDLAE